jgi:hypothetical protein
MDPPAVNHSATRPQYVRGMDETQTLAALALRELLDNPTAMIGTNFVLRIAR